MCIGCFLSLVTLLHQGGPQRPADQLCGMFPTPQVSSTSQSTGNSLGLGGAVPSTQQVSRKQPTEMHAIAQAAKGDRDHSTLSSTELSSWELSSLLRSSLLLREIKTRQGPPGCPWNFTARGLLIWESAHFECKSFFPGKNRSLQHKVYYRGTV